MLDSTFAFLESERVYTEKMPSTDKHKLLFEQAFREVRIMRTLPRIVCLCGSTRFIDEFRDANLRFTLGGEIVLSIGSDNQYEGSKINVNEAAKSMLDALHFRKIDLADRVFIINKNGYIGKSTHAELKYALRNEKPIAFLEGEAWRWDTNHLENKVAIHHYLEATRTEIAREDAARG